MNEHPIAKVCPQCGSASFVRVRAKGPISFTDDRKCQACGTRYTPPTPRWAAIVFLILGPMISIGSLLLAFGTLWVAIIHDKGVLGCVGGFTLGSMVGSFLLGIYCVVYGVRSLNAPRAEAPLVLPEEMRDRPAVTKPAPHDGFTRKDRLSQWPPPDGPQQSAMAACGSSMRNTVRPLSRRHEPPPMRLGHLPRHRQPQSNPFRLARHERLASRPKAVRPFMPCSARLG